MDLAAFDNKRGRETSAKGGRYFTLSEAARLLGVSAGTLRRRIKDGAIKAKPGLFRTSAYLIPEHELRKYERARYCGGLSEPIEPGPSLYTLEVAAKILRVSTLTLRRRIKSEQLHVRREQGSKGKILLTRGDLSVLGREASFEELLVGAIEELRNAGLDRTATYFQRELRKLKDLLLQH